MEGEAELVRLVASDALELPGLYWHPAAGGNGPAEGMVLVHGSAGNLAQPLLARMARGLAEAGFHVLTFSNRGREQVWAPMGSPRFYGNAFEDLTESVYDIDAAVDWMRGRGVGRITVAGHSLGGVKAVYYACGERRPELQGVIAVSPPRLSASYYEASPWADAFAKERRRMERLSAEQGAEAPVIVGFPLGRTLMCPRTFAQKYCGDEFDVTRLAGRIHVPLLYTAGTLEKGPTKTGMPEDMAKAPAGLHPRRVVEISGADPLYRGCEEALLTNILDWVLQRGGLNLPAP